MTDTASHVSPPGGVEQEQARDALACFDRDGAAVFASLCRSMAGDRGFAAEVLRQTFVQLDTALHAGVIERTDRRHLVMAAHRVYLADRRADDDGNDGSDGDDGDMGVHSVIGDEPAWVVRRWGFSLATLSGLTARERAALNLHLVDGFDLDEIATLLRQSVSEVTALIEAGRHTLRLSGTTESTADILRHAEMWLGDAERDSVRVALGAVTEQPRSPDVDDPATIKRRWRPSRPSKGPIVAAVVVCVLAAVGGWWLQNLPEDRATPPAVIGVQTAPVNNSGGDSSQVVANRERVVEDGAAVDVTQVPDSLAAAEVIFMAADLTDPLVVVPDAIIKYSDGKVGLSWHGPCNRPAVAVAITNTVSGAVVELTTGEFPVLSCVGMPDRWSAVVEIALPLAEGTIGPIDAAGTVVTPFAGYVEAMAPTGSVKPISEDAGFGSALVDDGGQPWVYGVGCSSRSARYQSPIGAIFEIRTETVDPSLLSTSDAVVCNRLASRPVLVGSLGAVFPQAGDGNADPIDCNGPVGSQTDVPSQRPYIARFYDGDWSTWDGCLVRTDVIFSESLFETCAGADLRTITFASTLGERITESTETVTFIRDPQQAVAGTRPPLLTYVIPPVDLSDTGLRYRGQQLWLSPRGMEAIYVRVGEEVERWPQFSGELTCT